MSLLPFLHSVAAGENLSAENAHHAMAVMLDGGASPALIAGFLIALKMKGETAQELAGFARAMRLRATFIDPGPALIDTCGTGGDNSGTFNISTAAALVMASAGAHISKHGNRSVSSQTGSADVLEALGVPIQMSVEEAGRSIRELGFAFLFAPDLLPAVQHVLPVRRELKIRTAFNLLGPLVNPGRAQAQLIGAPSAASAHLMAEALAELGTGRSFVVHGRDGLDEITTTGPTDVFEVSTGRVEHHVWTTADFGVPPASLDSLRGGDAARNAQIIKDILNGSRGSPRDVALVNAAAGLLAGGLVDSLRQGMHVASHSIDSGAARAKLKALTGM